MALHHVSEGYTAYQRVITEPESAYRRCDED